MAEFRFMDDLQHDQLDKKEELKHTKVELKRAHQNYRKTKERIQKLTQKLRVIANDQRTLKRKFLDLRSEIHADDSTESDG